MLPFVTIEEIKAINKEEGDCKEVRKHFNHTKCFPCGDILCRTEECFKLQQKEINSQRGYSMDCENCKLLAGYPPQSKYCVSAEGCFNYKPKRLPKVTKKEVALKFWEYADEDGMNGCDKAKEHFGIEDTRLKCKALSCGQCMHLFVEAINKKRGYSID